MRCPGGLTAIACLLVFSLPLTALSADNKQSLAAPGSEAISQRIDFLEERLDAGRRHANTWQKGWTGFYSVSTLAQGILSFTEDTNDGRVNNLVGAIKSAGGLLDLVLRPLPGRHGADPMRAISGDSAEARLDKLGLGEELLAQGAERARERTSWKRHLMVVGVNVVAGAAIWGFGDEDDALVSTAIGIAVGEANIWSQPYRAITDQSEYRSRFSGNLAQQERQWELVPTAGGVMLRVVF